MNHLLPKVSSIIKTDFTFIENTQEEHLLLNTLNKKQEHPKTVYLLQREGEFYYLALSAPMSPFLTQNDLPWIKTKSLPVTVKFKELIKQICQHHLVLIEDKNRNVMGYIVLDDVLQNLFTSYEYLKAYYDSILEAAEESISIIDEEGKAVVWTSGAEKIYSIKEEEIIGKPLTDFLSFEKINMTRVLKTGERLYRTQSHPREDIFLLVNIYPIELEGRIIGAVGTETDISNEMRLHQELFNSSKKVKLLSDAVNKVVPSSDPLHAIRGSSQALIKAKELCKKVASTNATCLIQGESGVGKELFAEAIHNLREKQGAPFIAINCGAISPTLLESELFGYEKGAFSGANEKGKKGTIELAQGGTLFLDEVGEMPLDMQVKLLRVLQEKKYYPVGGTTERQVDFRIVAATHRDLEEMVIKGEFREDLYYRLNVINLKIPSLQERPDDILELTKHFLHEFSLLYDKSIEKIPKGVLMKLFNYQWPGNIRELRNITERLVVFSNGGEILDEYLPNNILNNNLENNEGKIIASNNNISNEIEPQLDISLQEELESHEKKVIMRALSLEKGNKISTANRLGISRSALYYKLNKLDIN